MTFWILLAVAGFLTWLSLKKYNLLFSLCGSMGWLAVWAYNLSHPPTGVTTGTFLHDLLTYTFILMAIAVMFIYFGNRGRISSGTVRTAREQADYDKEYKEASAAPLEETEVYRQRVRRALHPRQRR